MAHLFFDESGCLGFDFDKPGTSVHFTVCLLAILEADDLRKVRTAVIRTLKNKINRRKHFQNELKANKDSLATKRYFLRQLESSNSKIQLYALTLNKKRVHAELRKKAPRLYNYLIKKLLEKVPHLNTCSSVHFIFDKCKSPKGIVDLNQYLFAQLASTIRPNVELKFEHKNSQSDPGLSAVDYFCSGIFKKYEHKDSRWFDDYQQYVKDEGIFLR